MYSLFNLLSGTGVYTTWCTWLPAKSLYYTTTSNILRILFDIIYSSIHRSNTHPPPCAHVTRKRWERDSSVAKRALNCPGLSNSAMPPTGCTKRAWRCSGQQTYTVPFTNATRNWAQRPPAGCWSTQEIEKQDNKQLRAYVVVPPNENNTLRPCLDAHVFIWIHTCWNELEWN
jgi:hypothetical protein